MLTEELFAALNGATGAAARVGPIPLKVGTAYPAITFQIITTSPTTALVGSRKPDRVLVQVDCWAATYGAAKTLAAQVRAVMEAAAFQGMMNDARDDYESETELYRVSSDYFCWDQEE